MAEGSGERSGGSTRGSLGVLIAAAGLVLAVWAALTLAPSADEEVGPRGARPPHISLPGRVPGFRADAWYLPDDSLLGFVRIEGGPFVMGSDPGVDPMAFDLEVWDDDGPGRPDLPTFFLQRYEVTVAQYAAFVNATGHPVPEPETVRGQEATRPVARVSWADAVSYAGWLDGTLRAAVAGGTSQDTGPIPPELARLVRQGWKVALPTEAQWEKAARGADGRIYPWGDRFRPDRANIRGRGPLPVGTFDCPECPYPVSDMAGNVWEWTRSPYQPYPYDEADDQALPRGDALWVMRGGSYADTEQYARAANRGGADPGARRPIIGFRVALVRD